jgi:hypothetical protein
VVGPDAAEPPDEEASLLSAFDPVPDAVPERRPVWAVVLVDLVLVGAVAGAAAVYLLLQ